MDLHLGFIARVPKLTHSGGSQSYSDPEAQHAGSQAKAQRLMLHLREGNTCIYGFEIPTFKGLMVGSSEEEKK